jgi:hypothetical protein
MTQHPEKSSETNCIHHWIIDRHNVGTCQKCGAVVDFAALQGIYRKELSKKHAEAARRTARHGERRGRKAKG